MRRVITAKQGKFESLNDYYNRYSDLIQVAEAQWGTLYPYDPVAEGGENWMQFRSRVGAFIEHLRRKFDHKASTPEEIAEESAIVVCHGGVIEACFEYVFES